jgi:tetratricopeptide (TPR) repeat protein
MPAPPSMPPSAPPLPRAGPAREQDLLSAVRELSANLLLTPEERQAKRRRQQEETGERLVRDLRDAAVRGDFAVAAELLRRLVAEFPADARAAELEAALIAARTAAVDDDLASAGQKAQDLMALAKFADARDVAQGLVARHPDEERARELLGSVAREEQAFVSEQKRRMYGELQRHATDRRWRSALASARMFLEKFPDSPEGKMVAVQIPTLEDNARLEEVRDLRDRIRECLERRRYDEALQLAREVIRRFPQTAAAAELAQQLPRLEELARGNAGGRS